MEFSRTRTIAGPTVVLLLVLSVVLTPVSSAAGPSVPPAIDMAPSDGQNLTLVDRLAPNRILVEVAPTAHNWFAGTFINLPTDGPLTIGFSMTGRDTRGEKADVSKWQGLKPVTTYADPTRYESYEWFRKDAGGRWVSGDLFKAEGERYAGTGAVPEQHAVPAALAPAFLSEDGGYWAPWREVDATEVLSGVNIFRLTHAFTAPTATVAMRVPFTYTYLQAFLARLQTGHFPGVAVEEIGATTEGRKLQIVRLDDPEAKAGTPPAKTILLIAREHATEPASSWVLMGALSALLRQTPEAKELRKNTTWLAIPIEDPDGSAHAVFDGLTDLFREVSDDPKASPEAYAYARYFTQYVYAGRTIHAAVTLHNVEANETEQIVCPFVSVRDKAEALRFNQAFFQSLAARGFVTGDPLLPWDYGFTPFRLYGWCAMQFGAFNPAFEVNDRYPAQRLSLARLREMGEVLANSLSRWLSTPEGKIVCARAEQIARLKRLERPVYYDRFGHNPEQRTRFDLITQGF